MTQSASLANSLLRKEQDILKATLDRAGVSKDAKSTYEKLLLAAYLQDPVTEELQAMTKTLQVPIFTEKGGKLHITRTWIAAVQQYFGINIIPEALLKIPVDYCDNNYYAEHIHAIHMATYKVLQLTQRPFTLKSVYRGALTDDTPLTLKGKLTAFPNIEEFYKTIDLVKHYRGCSFKPHACENYDIMIKANHQVVVAQGVDIINFMETVVVPTVLLSTFKFNPSRYKSTFDSSLLHVIDSKDQYDKLLYLFEIPMPAIKLFVGK